MLKTCIQPNTTTLNAREMVTLNRLQQEARIPWVQLLFNHLCIMTRTKAEVLTMPDNNWKILEYVEVSMRLFTINHGPENYN